MVLSCDRKKKLPRNIISPSTQSCFNCKSESTDCSVMGRLEGSPCWWSDCRCLQCVVTPLRGMSLFMIRAIECHCNCEPVISYNWQGQPSSPLTSSHRENIFGWIICPLQKAAGGEVKPQAGHLSGRTEEREYTGLNIINLQSNFAQKHLTVKFVDYK